MAERYVRVIVHGVVQGVGFRWAARNRLAEIGLDGTAQNLADGTVLIEARGMPDGVAQLLTWLHSGRTPGRVSAVDVDTQ